MSEPECTSSPLSTPMERTHAEQLARRLKAVADPARLQVLSLLHSATTGEACVCDLTEPLGLSQPTVSHHLRILSEAGFVRRERRGVWSYYSLAPEAWSQISALMPTRD